MTRELVLIHGRAQEHKDADALKREWLDALRRGLAKAGLALPIPEDKVRFPYYGQTLHDLVAGVKEDDVARVIVRGNQEPDDAEQKFVAAVMDEVMARAGVSDAQIVAEYLALEEAEQGAPVVTIERGVLNWRWVRAILKAVDRWVPGGSGSSIAIFTRDVYRYLTTPGVRDVVDAGVRQAMTPGVESVVVGHSLGSVVSYGLLRREGEAAGWQVPLFVTLGSPLAVRKIFQALQPHRHPACVGHWFNAMDPQDFVSLYPLDGEHFPIEPAIENKTDVVNRTPNQHGISGYLSDPVVAKRIHDALMAAPGEAEAA